MTELKTLIDKFIDIQRTNKLSDAKMAKRMGIHRSTWSLLRRGKYVPGREVLEGMARFTEVQPDIVLFLARDKGEQPKVRRRRRSTLKRRSQKRVWVMRRTGLEPVTG